MGQQWFSFFSLLAYLVLIFPSVLALPSKDREGKFFGLFNIVSFPNNVCNSSQDLMQGVCLSPRECSERGGLSEGSCASGFGACCLFISSMKTTGGGVAHLDTKVGYLQNPAYPQEDTGALMQMVQLVPATDSVCQLRIDLVDFELDGGSAIDKPCDRDSVTVMGTGGLSLGIGPLCGDNSGQHLYLPVQGARGGPASLRIHTQARGADFSQGYKWNIRVTQIDCSNEEERHLVAPEGCAQYFREAAGNIRSFNFDGTARHQYSPGLNYAICLKRPQSACQVTYRRDTSLPAFATAVGKAQPQTEYKECGDNTDNGCGVKECVVDGDDEEKKTGDYLLIPGGVSANMKDKDKVKHLRSDYYCGVGLGEDSGKDKDGVDTGEGGQASSGVVSQAAGPVVIRFVTDNESGLAKGTSDKPDEAMVRDELGWSINYLFSTTCTQFQFDD